MRIVSGVIVLISCLILISSLFVAFAQYDDSASEVIKTRIIVDTMTIEISNETHQYSGENGTKFSFTAQVESWNPSQSTGIVYYSDCGNNNQIMDIEVTLVNETLNVQSLDFVTCLNTALQTDHPPGVKESIETSNLFIANYYEPALPEGNYTFSYNIGQSSENTLFSYLYVFGGSVTFDQDAIPNDWGFVSVQELQSSDEINDDTSPVSLENELKLSLIPILGLTLIANTLVTRLRNLTK